MMVASFVFALMVLGFVYTTSVWDAAGPVGEQQDRGFPVWPG